MASFENKNRISCKTHLFKYSLKRYFIKSIYDALVAKHSFVKNSDGFSPGEKHDG